MTNELEKTFFDTFEIKNNMCKYAKYGYEGTEGTWYFCDKNQKECWTYPSNTTCKDKMTSYPEITDHILLELICICNSTYINGYTNYFMATGKTKEGLKEEILKKCIVLSKDIKCQVRTLFEGDTNDR